MISSSPRLIGSQHTDLCKEVLHNTVSRGSSFCAGAFFWTLWFAFQWWHGPFSLARIPTASGVLHTHCGVHEMQWAAKANFPGRYMRALEVGLKTGLLDRRQSPVEIALILWSCAPFACSLQTRHNFDSSSLLGFVPAIGWRCLCQQAS